MKATEVYARLTTDPVLETVEKATQTMAEHWAEPQEPSENMEIIDV